MQKEGKAGSGCKATGYTEIKDGDGNLLVAFNSDDAKDYWGNEYQKERIIYCMRHRRDKIPMYLRTGGKLPLSKRAEAERLRKLNLAEGGLRQWLKSVFRPSYYSRP